VSGKRLIALAIIILLCFAPTVPGIIGVLLTSISYVPALDLTHFSAAGYHAVFAWPGINQSILITLFTSIISTLLATLLSFAFLIKFWRSRYWSKYAASLSPLLAMPHVAFAIGFVYLFAPTGWIARLFEPIFSISDALHWVVNDPFGVGLILVLTLKEIPFVLVMSISILKQLEVDKLYKSASSLGYDNDQFWWKLIFPLWLPKIRFPLIAILIYSASVVDLSIVIGPTNPPAFAVLIWQWFLDPNLTLLPKAAAGGVLLALLCGALVVLLIVMERLILKGFRNWLFSGRQALAVPQTGPYIALIVCCIVIFPLLILWTFAKRWRFPDLTPSSFSIRFWENEWSSLLSTINSSIIIALISASCALILAMTLHELSDRSRLKVPLAIIIIPMIVPQISLLFGIQIVTLILDSSRFSLWVVWSHVFFAFPYVYLALDGPWRTYDQRYTQTALSMGKTMMHIRFKIKWPLLLPAIVFAWAIGASVSLAQYLPTIMLGGGRIASVTTEAVALMSGSDRRVSAIYGLAQAVIPLCFFLFAMLISHRFSVSMRLNKRKSNSDAFESKHTNPFTSQQSHS
jgi:putative thiamine transport system permease protein